MYTVTDVRQRKPQHVAKEFRSNSARALRTFAKVRSKSFSSLADAQKNLLDEAGRKIRSELKEVKAEAEEFMTSPYLLFRPVFLITFASLPLLFPLVFIPIKVLFFYAIGFIAWYVTMAAYFATEVAMRPPWYRIGLSLKHQPSYWKHCINDPKADLLLDFDEIQFRGANGRTLRGWFIDVTSVPPEEDDFGELSTTLKERNDTKGKVMVVFVHGAGRDRRAFLRHSQVLVSQGYPSLLFDLSEHGLSDGTQRGFSFGSREKYDVLGAIYWLRHVKKAAKVVVIGTSTGASSALLAEALQPGSADVIIAENPFTRPADLFSLHLNEALKNYLSQNEHHLWRRLVFWYFTRVLLIRTGHHLRNRGALDAARKVKCPVQVLHGTSDDVVPLAHGMMIYGALSSKKRELWVAEGAIHCALFDKYPEEWSDRVLNFISLGLQENNASEAKISKTEMASTVEGGVGEDAPTELTMTEDDYGMRL